MKVVGAMHRELPMPAGHPGLGRRALPDFDGNDRLAWPLLDGLGPQRRANTGGPMSRTRRERIRSTLLGNDQGAIRCPRVVRVGIGFHDEDPVTALAAILEEEGFASPEDLREAFAIPVHALVARRIEGQAAAVDARDGARRDVLWNALVLGLCTAQLYDPLRPVLWTQASLTRQLELFDPAGFYA